MGMNLQSCCHKCRTKRFHHRGKENETLLPFYHKHYACMRENPRNVETLEDQIQEADWMCGRNGYPDDGELEYFGMKTIVNPTMPDNQVIIQQQGRKPQVITFEQP